MSLFRERLKNGILDENVIFVQVLAMCPTLAVTTSAKNAIGMGLSATVVLMASNFIISLVRKIIPDEIRIPSFIVIIAALVTLLEFLMKGYMPSLYAELGIYVPLIVVNCVILGRAEAYASKNPPLASIFDGLGQGLGFTLSLGIIGAVREFFGTGTIFGFHLMPANAQPALIMILAPGAFFTLGILTAIINARNIRKNKKTLKLHNCGGNCANCESCEESAH